MLRRAAPLFLLLALGLVSPAAFARDALQSFGLAVRANDVSFVRQMPELGLNERTRDDLSNNLLMLAIRDDGEALVLALLKQPAWQSLEVLNYQNQLGETALMIAAVKGSVPVARALIGLGAEVNRAGWTPMHYAATSGQVEIIRLLAEKSAYIDAASPNKTTPLMMAARFNHRPAAAALIELGADPTQTNESGFTARDYAKELNNKDLAFWLELEEISFVNKYLKSISKAKEDATLRDLVIQSGGEIVTVTSPKDASGRASEAPAVAPSAGVEVFKGIE
jgi:ankyrin repeat protein